VPLVVKAQQHLRHRDAHQLGVGDLGRLARRVNPRAGMMWSVSST
jgi:hypothetical protein